MAEGESGGGVSGLYFLVGILLATVVVLAVLYFTGVFGGGKKIDVNLKTGEIHQPWHGPTIGMPGVKLG